MDVRKSIYRVPRGIDTAALWAIAVGGLGAVTVIGGLVVFAVYLWDRE